MDFLHARNRRLETARARPVVRAAFTLVEIMLALAVSAFVMFGCAAMMFDMAGITAGRKLAIHPLAKAAIKTGTATDADSEIDGNFFTAKDENKVWTMMPRLIETLKQYL